MKNYLSKPTFEVFIDVNKALCDKKYFNELKKKTKDVFIDEVINPNSMNILNNFLSKLNEKYFIDLIITSQDSLYAENLLTRNNFNRENVRVVDYLFSDDSKKSNDIEHYLTMLKKDKDPLKIHNFIIFDDCSVKLSNHLANHLVYSNFNSQPITAESISITLNKILQEQDENISNDLSL